MRDAEFDWNNVDSEVVAQMYLRHLMAVSAGELPGMVPVLNNDTRDETAPSRVASAVLTKHLNEGRIWNGDVLMLLPSVSDQVSYHGVGRSRLPFSVGKVRSMMAVAKRVSELAAEKLAGWMVTALGSDADDTSWDLVARDFRDSGQEVQVHKQSFHAWIRLARKPGVGRSGD